MTYYRVVLTPPRDRPQNYSCLLIIGVKDEYDSKYPSSLPAKTHKRLFYISKSQACCFENRMIYNYLWAVSVVVRADIYEYPALKATIIVDPFFRVYFKSGQWEYDIFRKADVQLLGRIIHNIKMSQY